MVTVCTVLPPPERPRLDAAGDGCFTTVHTGSFRDALRAARRKRGDALVLSVHACPGDELPAVARFVRAVPAIPARVPALDEGTGDVRAFFEAVARLAPVLSTVRRLARHLRICSSTLMSRFYRAGLPSPKTYLAGMRLVHAAYLFSNPGLSVADVAYRLDYSSPQSFGRHLKAMLGVTAGEFRRRFPFDVSLERSEEHTSELQSPCNLVCRLLLEKKKKNITQLGAITTEGSGVGT